MELTVCMFTVINYTVYYNWTTVRFIKLSKYMYLRYWLRSFIMQPHLSAYISPDTTLKSEFIIYIIAASVCNSEFYL